MYKRYFPYSLFYYLSEHWYYKFTLQENQLNVFFKLMVWCAIQSPSYWSDKVLTFNVTMKVNRGHLLVMNNLHIKLEDPTSMCSQVTDRTRFRHSMLMWPVNVTWPLEASKSIRIIYLSWPTKISIEQFISTHVQLKCTVVGMLVQNMTLCSHACYQTSTHIIAHEWK